MASLGNLDSFLNDKKDQLVDFNWLDINPKEYENVPFDPIPEYIAVPKLEEAWKHLEDKSINLVPNSNFNFNYKTPINSSEDTLKEVPELINYVKKSMMAGKTGEDLIEEIRKKASPGLIKSAQEHLKKLSQEHGLLGNVYVDPTAFKKCEEGAIYTEKRSKTAKYVKAMSSCSDCTHNNCGRCSLYKRKIASEINYDKELFSFYEKHLSNLKCSQVSIQSKDDLRKAFVIKEKSSVKIAENKPSTKKVDKEEKTLEQKKKEYNEKIKVLKEDLSNFGKSGVAKDISTLVIAGYSSKDITDHIKHKYSKEEFEKNKDVIASILFKQGSLGKIYIEAENIPYKSCLEAKTFLTQNAPNTKYIVVNPNKPFCRCKNRGEFGHKCRNLNKVIIPSLGDIPNSEWSQEMSKYPKEVQEKISSIFEKDKVRGLRLAFLQNEINKNSYQKLEKFDNFEIREKITTELPQTKKANNISLSSDKIAHAIKKGHKLSSIISFGKKAGLSNELINKSLKEAFEKVETVNKHQLDIAWKPSDSVKVIVSQKDLNIDLQKPLENIPDFAKSSSDAPSDNMLEELGLKQADLDVAEIKKANNSIEIEIPNKGFTLE